MTRLIFKEFGRIFDKVFGYTNNSIKTISIGHLRFLLNKTTMNTKNYSIPFVIFFLLFFSACKKDLLTKPVKFSGTKYATVGYDFKGKPNYLLKDTISRDLLSFIRTTLPNEKNLTVSHPELFTSSAFADIAITQQSDVFITFVGQDGSNKNSIA